ncbi:hypothetical protein [Streptomyces sp. NPDC003077]|uniref:hypothetical protein n=1 Tax=Streptomyces sp. NPDC003077 TaxID=3154443 RepID=UPI0033A53B62
MNGKASLSSRVKTLFPPNPETPACLTVTLPPRICAPRIERRERRDALMVAPNEGTGTGTTRLDDPESLKRSGNGANELAGLLKTHSAAVDDETKSASGAFKMDFWYGSLGVSIESVLSTWQSQTTALVNKCRDLHDKCVATSDNYLQSEHANVGAMKNVRPDDSPFG